jgi:ammonia channel protein AmtB
MMMNMMVFCIGAIGYWICGFAFQFGAVNYTYPETALSATQASPTWAFSPITLGAWGDSLTTGLRFAEQWGIIGLSGFFMQGIALSAAGIFAFFLFQMVFMDTAATIPTGSGAERLKFVGFVFMAFWVSMFIYPLVGNWVWGGGWLQNLGRIAAWAMEQLTLRLGVVHDRWRGRSGHAMILGHAGLKMVHLMPFLGIIFLWVCWALSSCFSAGLVLIRVQL